MIAVSLTHATLKLYRKKENLICYNKLLHSNMKILKVCKWMHICGGLYSCFSGCGMWLFWWVDLIGQCLWWCWRKYFCLDNNVCAARRANGMHIIRRIILTQFINPTYIYCTVHITLSFIHWKRIQFSSLSPFRCTHEACRNSVLY